MDGDSPSHAEGFLPASVLLDVMKVEERGPDDLLGSPYNTLQSFSIRGAAAAVPGGDAARQKACWIMKQLAMIMSSCKGNSVKILQ